MRNFAAMSYMFVILVIILVLSIIYAFKNR